MSSEPEPSRTDPVDAVVLAGTRGSQPFSVGRSGPTPKPLLEVGGEALVTRATRAALGAAGVGRVYVVGEVDSLGLALAGLLAEHPQRLRLVGEGADILDNCRRAFFHHLLPERGFTQAAGLELTEEPIAAFRAQHPEAVGVGMLVVASDLPFLQASDLEQFLRAAPAGVALVAGLCDHAALERLQRELGTAIVLDRWKLGAIPLRRCDVRWNNLWLGRPLMAHPAVYSLLDEIYSHRWLLDQDGRILWPNWWANLRALARHSARVNGRLRFARGFVNALGIMLTTGLARWLRRAGRWAAWPFRLLLGQQDLEFVVSLLLGVPIRVDISANVAPAIDIDVPESYQALVADDQRDYRRLVEYLGRSPAGPGVSAGS